MKTLVSDWETKPFPKDFVSIDLNHSYTDTEIKSIRNGLLPEAMEDKWFIYWENDILFLHRPAEYPVGNPSDVMHPISIWSSIGRAMFDDNTKGNTMPKITYLPCLDSSELAAMRKRELNVERDHASSLGHSAVTISKQGWYLNAKREKVDIASLVQTSIRNKVSIPPEMILPKSMMTFDETVIQVANETTLQAGYRLLDKSPKVLALNFANGVSAGGGFLHGARAQEECLCRSSSLYLTLDGDPMYGHHATRFQPDSTDWAILSPDVPVFRLDDGTTLDEPYLLSFLTSAAPYAPTVGKSKSAELMKSRIHRVLEIASTYGYDALVLGAWGCGAFDNDPVATAHHFKEALLGDYAGCFREIVFAITDWSPERRLLGVFRDVFQP